MSAIITGANFGSAFHKTIFKKISQPITKLNSRNYINHK